MFFRFEEVTEIMKKNANSKNTGRIPEDQQPPHPVADPAGTAIRCASPPCSMPEIDDSPQEDEPTLSHDENGQRFALGAAHLVYRRVDNHMIITHTEVPPSLRNRGLAGLLTRAALAEAEQQGWTVEPECSYTATFFERHPEFQFLLKK